MADVIVLVNGLPGSGKTTLADRLGGRLGWPVLSKDRVKEALADAVDPGWPGLGGVAMETVWTLASRVDGGMVIDSWWFRPRDIEHARAGLARCGADRCVEVWCSVPLELARSRYEVRVRHEVHRDRRDMTKEWAAWAGAGPLALGPVVVVDTSAAVDVAGLAAEVGEQVEDEATQEIRPRTTWSPADHKTRPKHALMSEYPRSNGDQVAITPDLTGTKSPTPTGRRQPTPTPARPRCPRSPRGHRRPRAGRCRSRR